MKIELTPQEAADLIAHLQGRQKLEEPSEELINRQLKNVIQAVDRSMRDNQIAIR